MGEEPNIRRNLQFSLSGSLSSTIQDSPSSPLPPDLLTAPFQGESLVLHKIVQYYLFRSNSIGTGRNVVFVPYYVTRCTVKKGLATFPSPVGMSLTASWAGIVKLFPARENLVSDIPAGDGNVGNLFLRCGEASFLRNGAKTPLSTPLSTTLLVGG